MAGVIDNRPKQLYLFTYNVVQAVGWSYCLVVIFQRWVIENKPSSIYQGAAATAKLFQALAVLEVIHAAAGLVKTQPVIALLQWAGRSNALFLVAGGVPEVQGSPFTAIMLTAWALTEVIRYPWYALTIMDTCPHVLTWLRYSIFIPLYPVGMLAEVAIMYSALPYLQQRQLYSISMPNKYNLAFSYYVFTLVNLAVYIPIWSQLYLSLFQQRRKRLGPAQRTEKKD